MSAAVTLMSFCETALVVTGSTKAPQRKGRKKDRIKQLQGVFFACKINA